MHRSLTVLNAQILRKGDFVLARAEDGETYAAEVIHRGRAFPATIGIRFRNGEERWFASREGTADILAGARHVNGQWVAL